MNRFDRVAAAIAGKTVDRVPVSAWGHFFTRELTAENFADASCEFVETYDWDFLKVHPRACYHVEGWGFRYEASTDPAKDHRCIGHSIESIDSWRALKALPLTTPALAEQLQAIKLLRERLGDRLPIIMTIFSPLDVAEKLVDRNTALLKNHLDADPRALEPALAAFTDTFVRFVRELVKLGVDGIYFTTQWASDNRMTPALYRTLVRPCDMAVLAEAKNCWFNVLHLCGDRVQLDAMADYPVQVMHWDMHTANNPSLAAGQARLRELQQNKAVGGGIDVRTLWQGTADEVENKLTACIRTVGNSGMLIGPGCSMEIARTPRANFEAMRRAAERAAHQP